MLENIPTSSDRCTTCNTCVEESNACAINDAQKKQTQMISRFENMLIKWATSTDPRDKFSRMNNISIPIIKDIAPETYDAWKTTFELKGYTVVNDGTRFTVSHT